jgi:predicted dehydrogenase
MFGENIMNVGIIGFGYMGQMYADLIPQKWKLIGVHDIDSTKFKSDVLFHSQRFELISKVDVVIICTPHTQHLVVLKECLQLGKHVILEKPMGSSEVELNKIYKHIQNHKDTSVVVVNITHCFYDKIQIAKQKLNENMVESITAITDTIVFPIKEEERNWWLFKKANVGHGVMLTNGCHMLARILHLFSEHVPRFEVRGGVFGNTNCLGDIEDSSAHMRLDLVLSNQRRIPVSIFANWSMAKSPDEAIEESMEIHTKEGILHVQAWNEVKFHSNPKEKLSKKVPYNRDTISGEIVKGVKNVMGVFEQAISEKLSQVHYSVEHTFQSEKAIATLYSKFRNHAYDTHNQSRLVKALDCAIWHKPTRRGTKFRK